MRWILPLLLSTSLCSVQLFAEQHIVSSAELTQSLRAASAGREAKLAQLDRLFSKDEVQGALKSAKIDAKQLKSAAAFLSDDELLRLSQRAAQIDRDIAAGALTNQQLTYIVIALATAVIVIILI